MKGLKLYVLGTALALNGLVQAEVPSFDMQELIVTTSAIRDNIGTDNINTRYVDPGKAATIPELLRQSTGIDIQNRTAYGDNQDSTVKLRGFDARRYVVLLDGRQINAAGVMGGKYIDWNSIPLDTVEKIQIIKGGKNADTGNTLGGTINIITKEKATSGRITLLTGEQGRYEYRVNYGINLGDLNLQVNANKTGADAFLRNNDYDADQYGVRGAYQITDTDLLKVGYERTKEKRGYIIENREHNGWPIAAGDGLSPGAYDPSDPNPKNTSLKPKDGSYWKKDSKYYDVSYKKTLKNGFLQLDYYKNDEQRQEVVKDGVGKVVMSRVIPSDKSDYWGVKGETASGKHIYSYGTDYKRLRYGYGYFEVGSGSEIYPSQKIDLFGAYVADSWQINERWSAYLGLRFDKFEGKKDAPNATNMYEYATSSWSPKFNVAFQNDQDTTTYFSANRVWRAPSMAEYYWWSQNYNNPNIGSPLNPNPNPSYHKQLKPEKGMSYEIAMTHSFSPKYKAKAAVYYEDLTDYINFRHTWPFLCYNIDEAKVWGLELENEYSFDAKNKVIFNYTNQHTKKSGVLTYDKIGLNNELDYSPRHKIGITYLHDAGPWRIRYGINYVSSQKEAWSGTLQEIGGYTVHNVGFTYKTTKKSTLSLYVDNIFDKEYAMQYDYPMSGRLTSIVFTQEI